MPRGYRPFASFRDSILSRGGGGGGHVYSLAGRDGILWCESRFLPANSGMKTENKKRSSARNLIFVLSFTCVFRPKTRLYSRLGEHKQYFGRYRPRNALEWHQACYFFLAQSSLGGTHFLLGGAHFLLGGARPLNAPRGAGPAFLPPQKRLFR